MVMRFVMLVEARTQYFQTLRLRKIGKCKVSVCLHLSDLYSGSLSLSVGTWAPLWEENSPQDWPLPFGSPLLLKTIFEYH